MIELSVAAVAAALGISPQGSGDLDATVVDVVVDSRLARPGTLFVALPGERVDGHRFVATALAQGAVGAVTRYVPDGVSGPCLVVDDPLDALGRLARHVIDRATAGGLQVVGITGSQGKTSTKDLLAQVLEQAGPTIAPYGNLNNEVGVPLTASRVVEETRFLVVEMGARGVGHIAYLCRLTPPRVGVVLNVGYAHVGEFGSQQAIARAKGELVEALPADGVAVLNADDPLVSAMRTRTTAPVMAFSTRGEPDGERAVWASDITSDALERCRFTLSAKLPAGERSAAQVQLRLSGRHHVANAVAAAAAALAVGMELEPVAAALSRAELRSRSRMEIHERPDGVIVINDAYNANPDSAMAALDTLAKVGKARSQQSGTGRTWAVLGDMLELGETAADQHAALGRRLGELGVDRLVAVGEFAPQLAGGAAAEGLPAEHTVVLTDKTDAAQSVVPYLQPGDTVLVKASRGLALDTVAEEIWTAPAPAPGPAQAPQSEDPA